MNIIKQTAKIDRTSYLRRPEHLAMLGKRGVSFREGGNGFGLSYAIEKVEQWGGKLHIDSELDKGTTITILLPKGKVPKWFSGVLTIEGIREFVITDDRPVIHTLVKDRLMNASPNLEKHFHHTPDEFESWYLENGNNLEAPIFVFDYDLGDESKTGIDLIQTHDLESKSVLMTNYYDDSLVQVKAENANIKIFPKSLIEYLGS